jgi:MHS family shikimate/dehydroshikimate transporter-like MFS transporter
MAAFGTYGVSFLACPFGAAIFGHIGHRVGRKAMLAMTIVLAPSGSASRLTYSQIGILAPVVLVV